MMIIMDTEFINWNFWSLLMFIWVSRHNNWLQHMNFATTFWLKLYLICWKEKTFLLLWMFPLMFKSFVSAGLVLEARHQSSCRSLARYTKSSEKGFGLTQRHLPQSSTAAWRICGALLASFWRLSCPSDNRVQEVP